MYNIKLDDNKYFTGSYVTVGTVNGGIDIPNLPPTESIKKKLFYKYDYHDTVVDGETISVLDWVFDEEKYNLYLENEANKPITPTVDELIASLQVENANLKTGLDELTNTVVMISMM